MYVPVFGILGATIGLQVICSLIDNFTGLIVFLDPENHDVDTKITVVRCIILLQYKSNLDKMLNGIKCDKDVLGCANVFCNEHLDKVNVLYQDIISACIFCPLNYAFQKLALVRTINQATRVLIFLVGVNMLSL